MDSIRAAVFEDVKKIVYQEDYPKPIIDSDSILVKTHYCGLCGSDVTNFKYKMYQAPLIMGHELAGEIVQLGENVIAFKIGDRVCGINISLDLGKGQLDGLGIFKNGGFAEYVKVPEKYLFSLPGNVSFKEGAMIESFANAIRGIKLSQIDVNQNILIIGGGNIGLCFLNVLLCEKEPNYIVVIEPHQFLREKAKEMGATDAFPPNKAKIKRFIKRSGEPSFIFDCAGNEDSILLSIDLIKKGGTILLEGIHYGSKISLPMLLINSKEICLKGCLGHDREDILRSIDLFARQKIDANKLISEVVNLENIQEVFLKFLEPAERKFIKILIKI